MNAAEFVACWKRTKDQLLLTYTDAQQETDVAGKIASMDLTPQQLAIMHDVLDGVLTDSFYTLLLGLDGATEIGGIQQSYQIHDKDGNLISDCGDLEVEAWEQFHGEAT